MLISFAAVTPALQLLVSAFPGTPPIIGSTEPPSITLSVADMSSPRKPGRTVTVLAKMNPICQGQFNLPLQKTTKSQLVCIPTANANQNKKQRIIRDTKRVLQEEMDKNSVTTIMGNCISWNTFDRIRKQDSRFPQ